MSTNAVIETDVATFQLDNRGFLKITLLDTSKNFDESEARRQIEAGDKLSKGQNLPALVVVKNSNVTPTNEAKEIIAEHANTSKEAIVVKSLGQRITANLYFKLSKKFNGTKRLFNDEDSAVAWLLSED